MKLALSPILEEPDLEPVGSRMSLLRLTMFLVGEVESPFGIFFSDLSKMLLLQASTSFLSRPRSEQA